MSAVAAPISILSALQCRRSRSSAAAIGHQFVLNACPPRVQIQGIAALAGMVCDWTVAILEEVIEDPMRNYLVRQYAIRQVSDLLRQAIEDGYDRLTRAALEHLEAGAVAALFRVHPQGNEPAETLCNHLSEAVLYGYLGQLPDF